MNLRLIVFSLPASFVSQNPALNFLVYTSPCDQTPLQVIGEDGTELESNAFLVPQWGGTLAIDQVYH